MSPEPSDNPNTGPNLPGADGALINAAIKGVVAASHEASAATIKNRSMLAEARFSGLQSLVDFSAGIQAFMTGVGLAGIKFTYEGNNFEFGGRFNTPFGFVGNHPSGFSSSPTGFSNGPLSMTLSPPSTMKGTTATGPQGGVH